MSSSTRTGTLLNLFLLRDTIYVSQHLNLLGSNPTIASGSRPEEIPACNETIRTESEVGGKEIQTPEKCKVPDELDDTDLPPLPMAL